MKCLVHGHVRIQCGTEAGMFHFGWDYVNLILWTLKVSGLTIVLYVGVVYVHRNIHR